MDENKLPEDLKHLSPVDLIPGVLYAYRDILRGEEWSAARYCYFWHHDGKPTWQFHVYRPLGNQMTWTNSSFDLEMVNNYLFGAEFGGFKDEGYPPVPTLSVEQVQKYIDSPSIAQLINGEVIAAFEKRQVLFEEAVQWLSDQTGISISGLGAFGWSVQETPGEDRHFFCLDGRILFPPCWKGTAIAMSDYFVESNTQTNLDVFVQGTATCPGTQTPGYEIEMAARSVERSPKTLTLENICKRGLSIVCFEKHDDPDDKRFDGPFRIRLYRAPLVIGMTEITASGTSYEAAYADLMTAPNDVLDSIGNPWNGPPEGIKSEGVPK